jgi:hypothetical protein
MEVRANFAQQRLSLRQPTALRPQLRRMPDTPDFNRVVMHTVRDDVGIGKKAPAFLRSGPAGRCAVSA